MTEGADVTRAEIPEEADFPHPDLSLFTQPSRNQRLDSGAGVYWLHSKLSHTHHIAEPFTKSILSQ
jgi:hypothetical protein